MSEDKNNHGSLVISAISGLVIAFIMCFTGTQIGPFAPLVIAFGIYLALFCLLIIFIVGSIKIYCKWQSSRVKQ